jgi:cell volume regulation protein A
VPIEQFELVLLVGAAVLLVSVVAVRMSVAIGLPSLLIYLGLGVLLGQNGIGHLRFDDAQLAQTLSFAALIVILTEGGLSTRWSEIRPAMPVGAMLATVGTLSSMFCIGALLHVLFGTHWTLALLLGAVTAPTDAAAVFSVLRNVPLPRRLSGALEAESGLNDAPTVLLVTALSASMGHTEGFAVLAGSIAYELVAGVAVGLLVGWLGAKLVRRMALPSSGLYPLAVLGLCVLAYAGAGELHASGFAAVYVAALLLGNADLPHRRAVESFAEGMGWVAQIGLFVMLGLLATPSTFSTTDLALGVVLALMLVLVARPVSVFLASTPLRLPWRDQVFLTGAGLRGAVPIVLATIPLAARVPDAQRLFDAVFVLVVLLTLAQGSMVPRLAGWLRLDTEETRDLEVETAPLDRIDADLLEVEIEPGSRLHGVEIGELRLPAGSWPALLVRGEATLVPDDITVLRSGDQLLVVATRKSRRAAERRLRAVSKGGRLADWVDRTQ